MQHYVASRSIRKTAACDGRPGVGESLKRISGKQYRLGRNETGKLSIQDGWIALIVFRPYIMICATSYTQRSRASFYRYRH